MLSKSLLCYVSNPVKLAPAAYKLVVRGHVDLHIQALVELPRSQRSCCSLGVWSGVDV